MQPAKPELILFDLGGVIVELTGVPRMLEWTKGRFTEQSLWHSWTYSPTVRLFETGKIDPLTFARGIIAEYEIDVPPEQYLAEFTMWPKAPFPGAPELLAGLNKRLPTASLSNNNAAHWPRFVNEMSIDALFTRNFPSHITGFLKPDPDAFLNAIGHFNLPPEHVVYFDDNRIHVAAAEKIGMRAFCVEGIREAAERLGGLVVGSSDV